MVESQVAYERLRVVGRQLTEETQGDPFETRRKLQQSSNVFADMLVTVPTDDAEDSSVLYARLRQRLEDSVSSGNYTRILQNVSQDLDSDLFDANTTSLAVGVPIIIEPPTFAPTVPPSDDDPLKDWQIALIVILGTLFCAGMVLLIIYFKKHREGKRPTSARVLAGNQSFRVDDNKELDQRIYGFSDSDNDGSLDYDRATGRASQRVDLASIFPDDSMDITLMEEAPSPFLKRYESFKALPRPKPKPTLESVPSFRDEFSTEADEAGKVIMISEPTSPAVGVERIRAMVEQQGETLRSTTLFAAMVQEEMDDDELGALQEFEEEMYL